METNELIKSSEQKLKSKVKNLRTQLAELLQKIKSKDIELEEK
jgi:hypothetical protein